MKKNLGSFVAAAGVAVIGALMTLDWSEVVSPRTAGVVLIILGGVGATIRAYFTPAPAQAAKGE